MEGDDPVALLGVLELDGLAVHAVDGAAEGVSGGGVGVGEAGEPVEAVEAGGNADGLGVLHDHDVARLVVVFKQDIVEEVDVDLLAAEGGAVAGDVGEGVAHEDALAIPDEKDDEGEDECEDEALQRASSLAFSSWYSCSVLMDQTAALSTWPAARPSTTAMAVSIEWS